MRKRFGILLCAMVLLVAGAAFAEPKMTVKQSNISFKESPTDEMIAQAIKEFKDAGGAIEKAQLDISMVNDAGLQKICKAFPGVAELYVDGGEITSLAPVAGLKGLTKMTLQDLPKVKDISPLAANIALTDLEVKEVPYGKADLKWLAPMTKLQSLSLKNIDAGLKSLEGIGGLTKLENIRLSDASLPDLSPLSKLESLTKLDLTYADGDLTPLKGCKNLKTLSLYGAKFKDLTPLAQVTTLQNLVIYGMQNVKDFNELGKIKSLESVSAGLTPMTSVAWAAELPNLKTVSFFSENIADFSPLGKAVSLEKLSFWKINVTNLDFLPTLVNLENLKLSDVNAKSNPLDLTPIASLPKLNNLNLDDSNVAKFEALAGAPALQRIYINRAKGIADISVLKNMTALKNISIENGAFPENQVKALTDAGKNVN